MTSNLCVYDSSTNRRFGQDEQVHKWFFVSKKISHVVSVSRWPCCALCLWGCSLFVSSRFACCLRRFKKEETEFFCLPRVSLSRLALALVAAAHALSKGDIQFTAFDASIDLFAIVALTDITAGTEIFFTDRRFADNALGVPFPTNVDVSDGILLWSVTETVESGTIVAFKVSAGTAKASAGTLSTVASTALVIAVKGSPMEAAASFDLQSTDTIIAYGGTIPTTATVVLAAISNNADVATSDIAASVCGSGLNSGHCLVQLPSSQEFAQYSGPRAGLSSFGAYLEPIGNVQANWNLGDLMDPFTLPKGRKRNLSQEPLTTTPFTISCAKVAVACPSPSIAFQTGDTSGACATLASDTIAEGGQVEILAWSFVGAPPPQAPTDLATAWLGTFNVEDSASLDGVLTRLRLTTSLLKIELFPDASPCTFVLSFGSNPNQRKRQASGSIPVIGGPTAVSSTSAGGDPHLKGMFGIDFDVFGVSGANYSLLIAPAFAINMQVSQFGPELRYMTRMSVLYRGKSIAFGPQAVRVRAAELIKHFEALGAKATIDGWVITVDLCPQHQVKFTSMHAIDGSQINFLDLEVSVPGCHDSYGGLLGQTYQCKYAKEKFDWSRDKEDSFRVPTLETPTGSYSPTANCANDDYRGRGDAINGSTQSGENGASIKMTR
jgi:hypothetical protein